MGVGEDFAAFKSNYNLNGETMTAISRRYRRITRQLNLDFWNTDSETAHSWYVGSYGRDTAARGVSDVDVGFLLPASLYHQYNAYLTNGQSALLQAVKRSIQKTFKTTESFGDGQVVGVNFTDGINFEVLPAFLNQDKQSWTYPNASSGGSWRVCNPWAETKAVKLRSQATNRNMKHLCRMMRIWRDYNGVPISGMLIDTLAYQFLEQWPNRDKSFLYHDYMARDFFLFMWRQTPAQSFWRAPGSGSQVGRGGSFERRAKTAYLLSLEAIQYNDYAFSRRRKWREIFGPLYPS
jgi:hypothetical protein